MSNIEDNGRPAPVRAGAVRGNDGGAGAPLAARPAHPAHTRAAAHLRLEIDIEAADLDELAKREALARLRAKGHAIEESKFFSRAVVERYEDGAVVVRVEE